jgi:hypothetical protein
MYQQSKIMRIFIISVFLIVMVGKSFGQQFKASSPLPPVEKEGFYRVLLTPEISPFANEQFSNIRLTDEGGLEVPYLFAEQPSNRIIQYFMEYKIERKLQLSDSCTIIIIKNPSDKPIRDISIRIKNAEISKNVTLYGSDDKSRWYAVKETFQLSNISSEISTSELKIVDFPLSNYRYYKVWIDDRDGAPLNVISAGFYEYKSEEVKYFPVKANTFAQADSTKQKQTFVRLNFDTLRVVDQLRVFVSGAPFYLRRGTVYTETESVNKKGKKIKSRDYLQDIELNSDSENRFDLPAQKIGNIVLVLENEDNPPLKFDSIQCSQLNRHVTAWLTPGKSYRLNFGDKSLQAPVYDIDFFQKNIPAEPPVLVAGKISSVNVAIAKAESFILFTTKSIIWVAIIVIIGLLAFMSVKLIRETGAAEKSRP